MTEVRVVLPKLFLRRRDQAEVMLGVLKVIFRCHRVTRGLGIARQLDVFLGDVVRSPADLHVGTVGFIDSRKRILALAVSPPHAFVLTVSHGFWFIYSDLRRPSRRFSPRRLRANIYWSRRCCGSQGTPRHPGQRPRVGASNSNTMAVSRPRSSRGVAHPSPCALSQTTRARPVKLSYPEPAKLSNARLDRSSFASHAPPPHRALLRAFGRHPQSRADVWQERSRSAWIFQVLFS